MTVSVKESQAPVITGICIGFAILTFIVLILRLFARIYVLAKMGVDDCEWFGHSPNLSPWLTSVLCRFDYRCLCESLRSQFDGFIKANWTASVMGFHCSHFSL